MSIQVAGVTKYTPAAYSITKVIQLGGTAMPAFNVGVIIGKQMKGKPYTIGTGASAVTADNFILENDGDFENKYGAEGDCEAATFFKHAKKKGMGSAFFIGINPTTQATAGQIGATPANSIVVASKDYGAHVNDFKLTIAASIHTITPTKKVTFLTADGAIAARSVTVKALTIPYVSGETVYLGDNTTAPVPLVVDYVDNATKTITFTTVIGGSTPFTTALYARVFQYDTMNQETSAIALDTTKKLADWYANSAHLSVTILGTNTVIPSGGISGIAVGKLANVVVATSPEATGTDWTAIAANFQRWNEEFALVHKFYLRVIGAVTPTAANHGSMRDLAIASAANGRVLAVISGCKTGDYLSTTSPTSDYTPTRAYALNSGSFQLAGFGLDGQAAYLSYAGQLFGTRLANALNHNQTNDDIVATTVEKSYSQNDSALNVFVTGGVMAIKMTPTGYKIVQGVSTYQDQSTTFSPVTKDTYLIQNRDVADFDLRATLEVLEALVGSDGVNPNVITVAVKAVGDKMVEMGYILSHSIVRIYKAGNAYMVERQVSIDSPTDFIVLTNTILVN